MQHSALLHCASSTVMTLPKISDGPEDVLIEILLRLPLKSLARFRCVSKPWLCLIDGPYFFHRRYPNSSTDPPAALLLNKTYHLCHPNPGDSGGEPPLICVPINTSTTSNSSSYDQPIITMTSSLSFVNPSSSHIFICNSCNGLLVCWDDVTITRRSFWDYIPIRATTNYFVVNPTTRQIKKLPRLLPARLLDDMRIVYPVGMSLAFDPIANPSISPAADDHEYKVVCVMSSSSIPFPLNCTESVYQILIYSSYTKRWKVSGSSFALKMEQKVHFGWSVFCKGAIHWYSHSQQSLYFNVENERLRIMDMPVDTKRIVYFGGSRDRLHIIDNCCEHDWTKLKIYEMRSDYSGWVVKHKVQLGGAIAISPQHANVKYYCWIHSFVRGRDDQEEEEFLVLHIPYYEIRCNFKEGRCDKIFKLPPVEYSHGWQPKNDFATYAWYEAFPYFESLARV